MKKNKFILTSIALILLYGCSSTPSTRDYYVLTSSQKSQSSMISGEPALLIRSVRLPSYLNEDGIAQAIGGGEVSISETKLWAEPFSESLPRILAKEIETDIQKPVIISPISPGHPVKTVLEVNVNQFISNDDRIVLDAKYRLIKPSKLDTHNFYQAYSLPDHSPQSLVQGYEKLIQELAADIAKNY